MQALARTLSILGHPLLLVPAAALLAMAAGGQHQALGWTALWFALFGAAVMAWSWWQVRRARWRHVDASARRERRSLNRVLLVALAIGAALAWRAGAHALAAGLAACVLVLVAALLSARACTLSLHVAFAVLAALLLWRIGAWATAAGLGFAAAVAWSRLALARHRPRDLMAGALAGAGAGLLFWQFAAAELR